MGGFFFDLEAVRTESFRAGPPLPGESTHTVDALSLQRCAKRAKQLGLRELESAALLCFARDALDYARTDECYEQEVLTRAYAPSKASRATLAAWKLAEDAALFEAPGPRDGPDTSMLMQTPQQRLERERKERREGQQDPQGLPKDCEIKDRSTVATNPCEGSIFRARCRRFMVQAAINGHNQFKRAQALEGRALLQAEQRYLQRQRRRRGYDEDDASGDLPEDRAPCVPRELACVDIAFECLFGDFDAGDVSHEIGEGLKPPSDTDTAGPADPDGSLRQASEAATAKALGLDLEDIEVRTRRLVKPESAVEPPRHRRAVSVPRRSRSARSTKTISVPPV